MTFGPVPKASQVSQKPGVVLPLQVDFEQQFGHLIRLKNLNLSTQETLFTYFND